MVDIGFRYVIIWHCVRKRLGLGLTIRNLSHVWAEAQIFIWKKSGDVTLENHVMELTPINHHGPASCSEIIRTFFKIILNSQEPHGVRLG
jgi:hypothetical protein